MTNTTNEMSPTCDPEEMFNLSIACLTDHDPDLRCVPDIELSLITGPNTIKTVYLIAMDGSKNYGKN